MAAMKRLRWMSVSLALIAASLPRGASGECMVPACSPHPTLPTGELYDRLGIRRGELKPAPDGSVDIKNKLGVTVGHIRRLPDGRTVIQDRLGVTRGTLKPSYKR